MLNPLEFYCSGAFATLRLPRRSKVPTEPWMACAIAPKDPKLFENQNIGIRCGLPYEDGYLVVIDVDPRNGGNALIKTMPDLPMTFTVKTGDGGTHYYFISEKPIRKQKLKGGIDIQGVGSFVLGASSVHPNGTTYILDDDSMDFIEELPETWLPFLKGEDSADETDFNPDVHSDPQPVEGSRNDYLAMEAGRLRRMGCNHNEILAVLKIKNAEHVLPPLPLREVEGIAKSICRYPAGLQEIKTETLKEETVAATVSTTPTQPLQDSPLKLSALYDMCPGLVKTLADDILGQARRDYPQFALSSALSIFSTCGQGSYMAPFELGSSRLGMYFWNIAPPSAGKDHYINYVKRTIRAVDDRLLGSAIGSFYGLRALLFSFNSRLLVMDEMQDQMDKFGARGSSYMNQILSEFKMLANSGEDGMESIVIKDRTYPAVKQPRLSIFGAGTTNGFRRHLNNSVIGDGLMSRFTIIPIDDDVPAKKTTPEFYLNDDVRRKLEMIAATGLTEFGKGQDVNAELSAYNMVGSNLKQGDKALSLEHNPQLDCRRHLAVDKNAESLLKAFSREQELKYQDMVRAGEADSELSPAATIDRSGQLAVKIASIVALGLNGVITEQAAAFAVEFTSWVTNAMVATTISYAASSPADQNRNAILRAVRKRGDMAVPPRDIYRRAHLSATVALPIIYDLCRERTLFCFESGDDRPVDLEGALHDRWRKSMMTRNFFPQGALISVSPKKTIT